MNISELIQKRRKELKLSVNFLANRLGISRATYYRYEKNNEKIPSSVIEPLALLLELPPTMLLGIQRIDSSLKEAESYINSMENNAEIELYIEELAQSLGYGLIKDYSSSMGKNISAIIFNDLPKKISEDKYKEIINSIKDFAAFKLNSVYNNK